MREPESLEELVGGSAALIADGAMEAPRPVVACGKVRRLEEAARDAPADRSYTVCTHMSTSRAEARDGARAVVEGCSTITGSSSHVYCAPGREPVELQAAQLARLQSIPPIVRQAMAVQRAGHGALCDARKLPSAKRALECTAVRALPIAAQATFQRLAVGQAFQGRVVFHVLVALIRTLPITFGRHRGCTQAAGA